MTRAHYIVRVGNVGIATTIRDDALNHWHYLSPQHIWGLPIRSIQVNVVRNFETDIENPRVTAYLWFLCNSHGGPSYFVQAGIGRRHLGQGPVGNGNPPIPADMMARLQHDFGHWFEWRPVTLDTTFQDQLRQLPKPRHLQRTLRHVNADHELFPLFEALIDGEEHRAAATSTALPVAAPTSTASPVAAPTSTASPVAAPTSTASPAAAPTPPAIEADLENMRREQTEAHSQGYIYLIHMEGTTFYKIGMSLDPQIRLQTLQTGNPYPLKIRKTQAVQDMRSAESNLHRQFEAQQVPNLNAREWFDFENGTGEVETAFGTPLKNESM